MNAESPGKADGAAERRPQAPLKLDPA